MWVSEQARHSPSAQAWRAILHMWHNISALGLGWSGHGREIQRKFWMYPRFMTVLLATLACVVWEKTECLCPLCAGGRQVREWWG